MWKPRKLLGMTKVDDSAQRFSECAEICVTQPRENLFFRTLNTEQLEQHLDYSTNHMIFVELTLRDKAWRI